MCMCMRDLMLIEEWVEYDRCTSIGCRTKQAKGIKASWIHFGVQISFIHGLTFMQSGRYTQGIVAQRAIHLGGPTRRT